MATQARATVQIDNARTRVTLWQFVPQAETGHHRHDYDYVVVPLTTGALKLIGPDGSESVAALTAGVSYSRNAGVEHNVVNTNDHAFAFVEIEIK